MADAGAPDMTTDAHPTDAGPSRDAATRDVDLTDVSSTPGIVVAIAVGWGTSCALFSSGQVACWGMGLDGELGNGQLSNSPSPVLVPGIDSATAITHGAYTRCALLQSGQVTCWGDNGYGELQAPASGPVSTPVIVPALTGAQAVSSGFEQTCALLAGGDVTCWGNEDGPPYGASWPIGLPAPADTIAVDIAYGSALLSDGTVACWGIDDEGELGNGTESFDPTMTATRVVGPSGVTAIATGGKFTCALLSSGAVSCWGSDSTGQLGSGPLLCNGGNGGSCSPLPLAVPGLTGVTAIAAGDVFACAVLSTGTVECWGDNVNGELGNGTTAASFSPVPVSGLTDVVSISLGGYHACALTRSGQVYCWGEDSYGETGGPPATMCVAPCVTTPALVPF